ncbi:MULTISPECIES: DddA-like double-stranded DNA deaminase toxin [Actinosynnema]|uniref:DddA-like double-stranded DNA deaminase toxin n=1 Tax=Actinosynnema TaxID=40566 RepID=UPI0020A44455|nr:DddA-like double-stranded DNA deaminase toxin [Actinosynnema pretiosum]MCP2099930.1 SCP1.201-like deaminase [Actinosynnema pretiosum]
MSLVEVAATLERVVELAGRADAELAAAGECAEAMRALVEHAAAGTVGDEAALLHDGHTAFTAELERLRAALERGRELVRDYRARLLADLVPETPPAPPAGSPTTRERVAAVTAGTTGDLYPVGSEWAMPLITQPHSAARSGVPLEGHVRALDPESHVSHTFLPGPGRWSQEAWQRIQAAGLPGWMLDVAHHVEPQATSWMREARVRHAMVVLNRPACGAEHGLGCHQALPLLLPRGYRPTVASTHGTRPHLAHYDGRAAP